MASIEIVNVRTSYGALGLIHGVSMLREVLR
jgi:hypothetical protein